MKIKAFCSPLYNYKRICLVHDDAKLTIGKDVGYRQRPCIKIDGNGKATCYWTSGWVSDGLPQIKVKDAPPWFPLDGTILDCELVDGRLL